MADLEKALIPQHVASGLHRLSRFLKDFRKVVIEVGDGIVGRSTLQYDNQVRQQHPTMSVSQCLDRCVVLSEPSDGRAVFALVVGQALQDVHPGHPPESTETKQIDLRRC
jgi:hypothetical protein